VDENWDSRKQGFKLQSWLLFYRRFLCCGKFRANMHVVVFDIVELRKNYGYCGSWYCGKLLTNMVYFVAIAVVEIPINCSCGDPKTLITKIAVLHIFFKNLGRK